MVEKNPDFRFNRMRKSGKTEFFEVHIERAVITHFKTVLFTTFCTFLATVSKNKHSALILSEMIR